MGIIVNEQFGKVDFTTKSLAGVEYEVCKFSNCSLAQADLSNASFIDCDFMDCDLSAAKANHTSWKDVRFKQCKLLGLNFSECNPFLLSLAFEGCQLGLASFYRLTLKGTKFIQCDLREADFTEAILTGAVFGGSDLSQAIFEETDLGKADLRDALNYSINLKNNRLTKAKFSREEVMGLLAGQDIIIE